MKGRKPKVTDVDLVKRVLSECRTQKEAAERLRITQATLINTCKRMNISVPGIINQRHTV